MIRIQNIYYMLAYAYEILQSNGYASCGSESFENAADLLAAILCRGVTIQLKRGLGRAYREETDRLRCVRGKIDVTQSVKHQTLRQRQLVCTFDEFSVDSPMNRVLKATMELLLRAEVSKERKKELHKLLAYFSEVSSVEVGSLTWSFRFDRNNRSYQMLIAICDLVVRGLLQTSGDGSMTLLKFFKEDTMCRLYEKFLLKYFQKHYPEYHPASTRIGWALDDGVDGMLPVMQSDVMLTKADKTLIVDAKYYEHATQARFGTHTLHSDNLYQMFTYVKNRAAGGGEVSGLLLYAKTDEVELPKGMYQMSGNRIGAQVLDLGCPFERIRAQLDAIVAEWMVGCQEGA